MANILPPELRRDKRVVISVNAAELAAVDAAYVRHRDTAAAPQRLTDWQRAALFAGIANLDAA